MKRVFVLSLLGALLVGIPVAQLVWGKAHVPVNKVQVCHDGDEGGKVLTLSENALEAHIDHGDCQLPACDFNNIFHTGDSCDVVDSGDGRCVLPNPRDPADGVTPGCPVGTF